MNKAKNNRNVYVSLLLLVFGFFATLFGSIALFSKQIAGKKADPLKENEFLKNLDFTIQSGPKSFWKKPTGLKIGRSLSTLLHFIFFRDETFSEKKELKK